MVEVRFNVHPALLAALNGLADHKGLTLDQLLTRLIDEGLSVELKIADLKVLDQRRKLKIADLKVLDQRRKNT